MDLSFGKWFYAVQLLELSQKFVKTQNFFFLGPCHTRHFCTQYFDKKLKDIMISDNFGQDIFLDQPR